MIQKNLSENFDSNIKINYKHDPNLLGGLIIQIGSKMIINEKGNFSGSVSGGCVETSVIKESIDLIKSKKNFKKLEFEVSNENAWNIGLACGGKIQIFIEQIN